MSMETRLVHKVCHSVGETHENANNSQDSQDRDQPHSLQPSVQKWDGTSLLDASGKGWQ